MTRCVPIIRYLQGLGHALTIACNDRQRTFIEETFDAIDIIHLEGYEVRYGKTEKGLPFLMLSQLPALFRKIRSEHEWLLRTADKMHLDGIISDNRYGLYHPHIPSVIMTHQLEIQTGMGDAMNKLLQKVHYKFLNRFNNIWVPDLQGEINLAGKLSHSESLPVGTCYLGLLSQFELPQSIPPAKQGDTNVPLLILLSGTEPQRSILSKKLWQQVQDYSSEVNFVEGSTNVVSPETIPSHITYHKQLAGKELLQVLQDAGIVISRSGYSTLMDLVLLKKKAIIIPTPGQTEQEYLGRHLHELGIFYSASQKDFNLKQALKETMHFPFKNFEMEEAFSGYKKVLDDWLRTLA